MRMVFPCQRTPRPRQRRLQRTNTWPGSSHGWGGRLFGCRNSDLTCHGPGSLCLQQRRMPGPYHPPAERRPEIHQSKHNLPRRPRQAHRLHRSHTQSRIRPSTFGIMDLLDASALDNRNSLAGQWVTQNNSPYNTRDSQVHANQQPD